MNTELMASKSSERQSQLTTANMENFESKLDAKKTSSLNSLLYNPPSYDRKVSYPAYLTLIFFQRALLSNAYSYGFLQY